MERRGGGGGRPWRPRGAARGPRGLVPFSSSSSHGDRWRSSPSQPSSASYSAAESKGDRKLLSDDNSTARRAREPVVDEDTAPLVGTCPDMCPAKERGQREQLRDLAVFERLDGHPGRTSPTLAVKKFCRTMSTRHMKASDIRPLPVLQKTLGYLLDLAESSDHSIEVVHDFVFDRTRSIRQDLSVQKIVNNEVIHMLNSILHQINGYENGVANQIFLRCFTSTWNSSLNHSHPYMIYMPLTEGLAIQTIMKLSSIHSMYFYSLAVKGRKEIQSLCGFGKWKSLFYGQRK